MGDTPMTFLCPMQRRGRDYRTLRLPGGHRTERTGRTKPNPSRRRGQRTLGAAWEYRCTCGHIGWSTHAGVLTSPLATDADRSWRPIETLPRGGGRVELREHHAAPAVPFTVLSWRSRSSDDDLLDVLGCASLDLAEWRPA